MKTSVTAPSGSIEWLGDVRASTSAVELGGKAASLDRLARLGFLIPPGFCLTTTAFEAHLATIAAHAPLTEVLARLPDEESRLAIVGLVRDSPAPTPIQQALRDGLGRLAAAGETSFAVRSSALGEDGAVASYAGLHDTELGLALDEVEPAVRRCWSSLWSAPAVAYRQARSLRLDGAAMAVVVQALVPADAAAVVFTRHPVTGRDDQLVITAVRGLGEPMVAGSATPDTYVVDKATEALLEFSPGDGGERLFAIDGKVTRAVDRAAHRVLTDGALADLVTLSLRVERAFGAAVDIEAAHARGQWYLLQARPITTNVRTRR
jgi:phosphoenolpyruvate synthase/pyruvate phosphate dikinase